MTPSEVEALVLAYVSAWNERDPQRCRAFVERCFSPAGLILGPGTRCVGREALLAEIAKFHRERPGERGILTSGVDGHHQLIRFTAAILDAQDRVLAEAVDIAKIGDDGLIVEIMTFWGPPAAVPAAWPPELIR